MQLTLFPGQDCTQRDCGPFGRCQNGGTCLESGSKRSCICKDGWTGEDCSENIDDCEMASCAKGATCIDRVASFFCQCPYGRTGEEFAKIFAHLQHYLSRYNCLALCLVFVNDQQQTAIWRKEQTNEMFLFRIRCCFWDDWHSVTWHSVCVSCLYRSVVSSGWCLYKQSL